MTINFHVAALAKPVFSCDILLSGHACIKKTTRMRTAFCWSLKREFCCICVATNRQKTFQGNDRMVSRFG